jgi:replicative DNA helicase
MEEAIVKTERERRKSKAGLLNPMDLGGKLPPQARELEEAVLGGMLLEKESIGEVAEVLSEDHFYVDQNKHIYKAIREMYDLGEAVDLLSITQKLRSLGTLELAGGPYYLAQLTNRVTSAANIQFHARILTQKFIQRELIRVAGEISRDAFEEVTDAFELLDHSEHSLYDIKNRSMKKGFSRIGVLLNKAISNIQNVDKTQEGLTGIPSGFTQLDRLTSGFQKSDLIIVAARPGMGKTAFALSLARSAAVNFQRSVAIFSLEMQDLQLVNRLISAEAEIDSTKLRSADLTETEWRRLHERSTRLDKAKIYIDDTPQLSIFDLKAKCRRMHSQDGLDMIIIDYLQLLRADDKNIKNREQEISHISRSLKGMAKELDVPVIALAQLSREVEKRANKRPQLSDLRESGSIEQDADQVLFLYRDEYYNRFGHTEQDPNQQQGFNEPKPEGQVEILLAKNRHGETGAAHAHFEGKYSRFEEARNLEFTNNGFDNSGIVTFASRGNEMNYGDDDTGANISELF